MQRNVNGGGGKTTYKIDFDQLRQELSKEVVEGAEERYQFTWPDKRAAIRLANAPTNKTLRPCREESGDFDNTQNLYIEGDNLEVLKLLREDYLGKVKMIYIDPPYNTGNDFVYNDDFAQKSDEYVHNSGQEDEEGNRLVTNAESNGRFHTDWLNMIYPRLKVARDLRTDDGVIFISIDNHEVENLRKVCDEIFGADNYVSDLVLQTATDNNPRQITTEHEYIVCYVKNLSLQNAWVAKNTKAELIQDKYKVLKSMYGDNIEKIQMELRKWIKANISILDGVSHYDNVDKKGVFHDGDIANTVFGGYKYKVIHPLTGKPCKIPEKGFRFSESTMKEMIASDDIMFGNDETTLIKPKKRLENAKDLLRSVIYEDGRASTKQFESLMARDIFQNPKSTNILSRLMDFILSDGDIVLDFFSGSGSSADAAMNLYLNSRKKVRFILVQIQENLDISMQSASSRAKQTIKNAVKFLDSINKPHYITEIGKERIRRAGKKIKEELIAKQQDAGMFDDKEDKAAKLDTGFRVLKLDSSNMNEVYYTPVEFDEKSLFEENIKADRTDEDLLFQTMLELGIELSAQIDKKQIAGKDVFVVSDGYLIACFDEKVNEEVIKEIAQQKPYYFVMRDSSLAQDNVADNFDQIFDEYSKDTIRRIL